MTTIDKLRFHSPTDTSPNIAHSVRSLPVHRTFPEHDDVHAGADEKTVRRVGVAIGFAFRVAHVVPVLSLLRRRRGTPSGVQHETPATPPREQGMARRGRRFGSRVSFSTMLKRSVVCAPAVGRDVRRPGRGTFHGDDGLRAAAVRVGRKAATRKGAPRDAGCQDPVGRDQRTVGNAAAVHEIHRPVVDVVLVVRSGNHERRRQRRGDQRQGRPVLPAAVRTCVPGTGVRQEATAAATQRRHGATVGHEETARKESE